MGKNIGYEQNGDETNFERPVLVLKDFNQFVCLVVPLTTVKKKNVYYRKVGIIDFKKAYAILSQLRLVDTKRFLNKIGYLKDNKLMNIKKAIWFLIR